MRKSLFTSLAIGIALPFSALAADSYTIDSTHTYPHFSISHLGFSTMQGRFDSTSGKVTLDRAAKSGSVEVAIGTASLSTGLAKRDEHLRGLFQRGGIPGHQLQIHRDPFQWRHSIQRGWQPDHTGRQQAGHPQDRCILLRHEPDEQERYLRRGSEHANQALRLWREVRPA